MAMDEDTGIDAKSTDGEGTQGTAADELAKRRGKANGGGSVADRAMAAEQAELDGEGGEGAVNEADDGQYFVWEQGTKVTLGTLIARGIPVEHAFVFGGKRLKGRGQLMGFAEDALIVGRGKVGKTAIVPTRDEDEKVTKVTIETHIALKIVVPAASDEAAGLLAALYEKAAEAA